MKRHDGRAPDQLRTLTAQDHGFGYAPGMALVEVGSTKVLCSVTLAHGVPPFLRGKNSGWLTAEYAMLPTATQQRTARASAMKCEGRSIEISRLIGRALRSVVNLSLFSDYTITVDCDVLQADGGTRTACISAACLALMRAQDSWLSSRLIKEPLLKDMIAAVSVGVVDGVCVLDPSYQEDSNAQADFNFVMSGSGGIIEVQGGAEQQAIDWDLFLQAQQMARVGVAPWFALFEQEQRKMRENRELIPQGFVQTKKAEKQEKVPLFSLQNRLKSLS